MSGLPSPSFLAAEIVDGLETAHARFTELASSLPAEVSVGTSDE